MNRDHFSRVQRGGCVFWPGRFHFHRGGFIVSLSLPKIGVHLVGHVWPRFILARSDRHYWTGNEWTPHRHKALLYYHVNLIEEDRRKLLAAQRRDRRRQ